MLTLRSDLRIMVASWPVDFRRGMDSLVMLVSEMLHKDPFCGDLFIFRSKRSDRIKILTTARVSSCIRNAWRAAVLHGRRFLMERLC
jgi:transposase